MCLLAITVLEVLRQHLLGPRGHVAMALLHFLKKLVSGHSRYATALHGQCRGRTVSQHQHSRDAEALHSGETVRELLTHSDNDPLQEGVGRGLAHAWA